MQMKFGLSVIMLLSGTLMAASAWCEKTNNEAMIVVYRDSTGELSDESKRFAKVLAKKAKKQGTVALWLTLNMPYQTDMAAMTPDQIAAQEVVVKSTFAELFRPLIARNWVRHPNGSPLIAGNGCRILATARGVEALVSDDRILHLIETVSR